MFKVDWALDGADPLARDRSARRAATVHLGGTLDEIAASERRAVARRRIAERPFVLVAQQSLFDPTPRAGGQAHRRGPTATCPNGSTVDMTDAIEAQVERFAPGFRDRILARSAMGPAAMERTTRTTSAATSTAALPTCASSSPARSRGSTPYATPLPGVYLCSSSTPPGGGVHGMCGFHAARPRSAGSRPPPAPA